MDVAAPPAYNERMTHPRLPVTLASLAGFLLACGFLEPADSGEASTSPSISQSSECSDYLDCLQNADPEAASDAEGKYGADGSCWSESASKAASCTDICSNNLEKLQADYGNSCSEGTDTGDTGSSDTGNDTGDTGHDTGSTTTDCPMLGGYWLFSTEYVDDGCDLEGSIGNEYYGQVTCNSGDMTLTLDVVGVTMDCLTSGKTGFTCSYGTTGNGLSFAGNSGANGTTAAGDFEFEIGCTSNGSFTGEKQ